MMERNLDMGPDANSLEPFTPAQILIESESKQAQLGQL
jgi:hypothetical protein